MEISVLIIGIGRQSINKVIESAKDADQVVIINNPKKQLVANMAEGQGMCTGDVIVYLNDWIALAPGWRQKLEKALDKIKNGVVSFHPNICITGAVTRDFLETELGGYIFWPDYVHYHCDQEIGERARKVNHYTEVLDMVELLPKEHLEWTVPKIESCVKFDWETYHIRDGLGFPNRRVRSNQEVKDHT